MLTTTATLIQSEILASSKTHQLPLFATVGTKCSFLQNEWLLIAFKDRALVIRQLFTDKGLRLPTKSLTESLIQDFCRISKKGFAKEYSRLRVHQNDDRIDIHFKEID